MKLLLDTSRYLAFKRDVPVVVEMIVSAETILFSPIVLGELMFGFRNGARFQENMRNLDALLGHEAVELVEIGEITSDRYSRYQALQNDHAQKVFQKK